MQCFVTKIQHIHTHVPTHKVSVWKFFKEESQYLQICQLLFTQMGTCLAHSLLPHVLAPLAPGLGQLLVSTQAVG